MHAKHHLKQGSCNNSALTGQTGHHHRLDLCSACADDQHSDRSDQWPRPVRPVHTRGQKWFETTWKPSKCIQQAISSSNFSPLLAMHESSQKGKTFNLELPKYTKFNIGCYTCPNEQVRYSIASYRSQLHDYQVLQPLDEAKMDLGNFVKKLPLMSKVLNKIKTYQIGKATQTSCQDTHSNHKTITSTHKHLMSCQSHRAMCLLLLMRLLIGRHHATV
jgi:hypothetical protein